MKTLDKHIIKYGLIILGIILTILLINDVETVCYTIGWIMVVLFIFYLLLHLGLCFPLIGLLIIGAGISAHILKPIYRRSTIIAYALGAPMTIGFYLLVNFLWTYIAFALHEYSTSLSEYRIFWDTLLN